MSAFSKISASLLRAVEGRAILSLPVERGVLRQFEDGALRRRILALFDSFRAGFFSRINRGSGWAGAAFNRPPLRHMPSRGRRSRLSEIRRPQREPGRPASAAELVSYLDSHFAPETFRPYLKWRRGGPDVLRQIVEGTGTTALQQRRAIDAGLGINMDGRQPAYQMSGTFFGRLHTLLNLLENPGYLPPGPRRILQGGSGLYPWSFLEDFIPGITRQAPLWGYRGEGMVYESAELARLAKGGQVHLMEVDERVLASLDEILKLGMIIDRAQPIHARTTRLTIERMRANDPQAMQLLQNWAAYVENFIGNCRPVALQDGAGRVRGYLAHLEPELGSRIHPQLADIGTTPIEGEFDLAWLSNLYLYMPEPLWFGTVIRSIAKLPISEEGRFGGLLVTNRFDLDARIAHTPLFRKVRDFLDLAGMSVLQTEESPIETDHVMLIARRVRSSAWLDEKIAALQELGL